MPRPSTSKLDAHLGMEMYATDTQGIGGVIRLGVEDFLVEEVIEVDGRHGGYVLALIEKTGVDTFTAVRLIARSLRIPTSRISFAGLKDSMAKATQFLSIKGVEVEDVERLDLGKVRVLWAKPFDRPLSPSMVKCNRFTVTLRRLSLNRAEALSIARLTLSQLIAYGGPPNYYGYQRFGSRRPNTHIVGRLLLEARFKEAFEELVFHAYPWESEAAKRARGACSLDEALRLMPKSLVYERSLLNYLKHHPGDYEGAFMKLPPRLLRLLVEAYQAYLFNKALSERLKRHPRFSEPVEGDYLILADGSSFRVRSGMFDKAQSLVKSRQALVAMPLPSREAGRVELPPFMDEPLRREGVELESLPKPRSPWLRLRAGLRTIVAPLSAVLLTSIHGAREDEAALVLRFNLPRGCYATTLLRELVKPSDPVAAGF